MIRYVIPALSIILSVGVSAQTVSIEGTVSYTGTASGFLLVSAITNVQDVNFANEWEWETEVDGAFTNDYLITNMPANTYYVVGVIETNLDSDETSPWGHYLSWTTAPVALDMDPGDAVTNIDFELVEGSVSNNPYMESDGSGGARTCDGDPETCLNIPPNWEYEGMVVDEPYFFDSWIVQLSNGWYRLYANSADQILYGTHAFDSYLSSNGVDFAFEPGHRFEEFGCFMPCVLKLSDTDFRCYYTDQSIAPNCGAGECGGRAINSAISTNGGLDFVVEGECLACDTNLAHEFRGIRGARVVQLTNGNYRMYYHAIDSNYYWRVLSASSTDGTNFTRDSGVRLEPVTYCPPSTSIRNFAPLIPFDGTKLYMYVTMSRCGENWSDAQGGIFQCWSTDQGLTFTVADEPVLLNYYPADTYAGDPNDPQVTAQDPTAIMTTNGLRLYFGIYDGPDVITNVSGIYSVFCRDFDDDGFDDWEEYLAGTDPNDSDSYLGVESAQFGDVDGTQAFVLSWSSVTTRLYRVERATNLMTGFDQLVATNLPALPSMNIYTDETATGQGPYYYRIRLE